MTKNIYCQCLGCEIKLSLNQPKFCSLSCSTIERNRVVANKKKNLYRLEPNYCFHCREILSYAIRKNKFCSRSCSISHNNKLRILSQETKNKIGESVKKTPRKKSTAVSKSLNKKISTINKKKIKHPYSKVELRICEYTGKQWWYNGRHRRLSPYRKNLKEQYYDKCAFKFNVYHYPKLFNLSLIEKYGWYSCPGKNRGTGIKNINGVSRDHKVSIKEAFENSYDPYYISHIMNCEIVLHLDNVSKNSKSSISYKELISLVNEYDKKLGKCT